MNKLLVTLAVAFLATTGRTDSKPRLSTIERQAKLNAIVNQRAGGFLVRPGSRKGFVAIVDCQRKVPAAWLDEIAEYFRIATRLDVRRQSGKFDFPNPEIAGNVSLFVIDDEKLPPALVAPDSRWAFVNVAPLAQEQRPAFFEARTKKELARTFAFLCGAAGSRYERSLTRAIASQSDLDKNPDYELPMDVVQRLFTYLEPLGVSAGKQTTYRQACQEGWAAAPTNDVQKAIWKQVHKVPDKPLTIEFDGKK